MLSFAIYLIDEEMMSTEVTPPSSSELTELGKCLMKQEVRKMTFCPSSLYMSAFLKGNILSVQRSWTLDPNGLKLEGSVCILKSIAFKYSFL